MRRALGVCIASLLVLMAAWSGRGEPGIPARAAVRPPRIAAVGDIACKDPPKKNRSVCQYDDVAATIASRGYDRVLLLGDIQYEYGRYRDFIENYDVYFGGLLEVTAPAPGNHDHGVEGAAGYFKYFGDLAPGGWYSFDLGAWHIVSLDSTICGAGGVNCMPGSPQYEWLAADLAASSSTCALAYWHHPRWDWLHYSNADWTDDWELRRTEPLYDLLYANGVDVLLAGHNHNYSRWMPADASGEFDPSGGVTQYIVGTGGRNLNSFGNFHTRPQIFVRGQAKAFGFLQLRLRESSWDFEWVSARGQPSFIDAGRGGCN